VALRAGLDTEARGNILCLCRGSNPGRPIVQSVIRHCTGINILMSRIYFKYCSTVCGIYAIFECLCYIRFHIVVMGNLNMGFFF
jgi:hypothetical protein